MFDFQATVTKRAHNRTTIADDGAPIALIVASTALISPLVKIFLNEFPEAAAFSVNDPALQDGMARVSFFVPLDMPPYCVTNLDVQEGKQWH